LRLPRPNSAYKAKFFFINNLLCCVLESSGTGFEGVLPIRAGAWLPDADSSRWFIHCNESGQCAEPRALEGESLPVHLEPYQLCPYEISSSALK